MDYNESVPENSMLLELPRETHICHFYKEHAELIEVVVPYILQGILHNDMCILVCPKFRKQELADVLWATCNEMNVEPAQEQIQFIESGLEPQSTSHILQEKYLSLGDLGYEGLKISFISADCRHMNILDAQENIYFCWRPKIPITVMCSYSIKNGELQSIAEIAQRHKFLLTKKGGKWQVSKGCDCSNHPLCFAEILDQNAIGLDTAGRIIDVTQPCLNLFSCDDIAQLGETFEEFIHDYSAKSVTQTIQNKIPLAKMRYGETLQDCWKMTLPEKGDANLLINLHKTMWRFITGDVLILTLHDITAFTKPYSLTDEIIPMIVHEIKNPLQTLKATNDLVKLSLEKEQEDLAHYISMSDMYIEQIAGLTEDLLTLSRLQTSKPINNEMNVDLTQLLTEVVGSFATQTDHRLILLFDQNTPCYVAGNPCRIVQIVTNLLQNAVKFTPEGGQIWIDLQVHDNTAVLIVEDEGIGVPPEESERIFEPFFRSSNAQEHQSGLGLGLYISKRLANLLGGDLLSKPRPQAGTIMELSLPLADPDL